MRAILALGISFVLLGGSAHAADMSVSFEWGPTKKCFDPKSPPFKLASVPAETKTLEFRMVDMNALAYNHGGGKLPYNGQAAVPYGAFRYQGPCPPSGSHTYSWTVKALDAKGKVLATAKARKMFP
ncbi:phospholipid-binding protein [Brucella sp. IR073]|uniref:phospholipid-binding protein n=1 Tax=unclassified Brucella TaxID=2632610 RepID=UPI003B98797E